MGELIRGEVPEWTHSGYGYGDGYGDGSGYGYGDGSGSGSGYGYGDGSGSGYGSNWRQKYAVARSVWMQDKHDRARIAAAEESASVIAFWCSDGNGLPINGGSRDIEPARPGRTLVSEGPLQLCSRGTLHATMKPDNWRWERVWVVALYGPYVTDGEKYGALRREIIGEIKVAA